MTLIPEITINGRVFKRVPLDQLNQMGADAATKAEGAAIVAALEGRQAIRQTIAAKAGDEASLLGTTSDAAALAVYGLASLVSKLATATTLAEVREAAEPFAALSADFLTKVESGEVKLPFMQKGLDTVVTDIETRATAVSDALTEAQKGG